MQNPQLQIAQAPERESAIGTLVAAFSADPVLRWVYPDAAQYLKAFPRLVEALAGKAFDTGSAYAMSGTVAVALWLGPGIESDGEAVGRIIAETVPDALMDDLGGFVEQMAAHHPHEPHWYLPLIGVDPFHQGRGFGSALMSHTTAMCDEARLPAYLEATSASNRRLYERHGFEVVAEIQHGSSPAAYAMRREPR